MRTAIAVILFLIMPAAGYSHPGKTDLYGGHKCFKKCEDWGLYYAEYHLHDKDGRPIRVSKKKATRSYSAKKTHVAVESAVPEAMQESVMQPTAEARSFTAPAGALFSPLPFLLAVLALLLIWLLMRMRRRRIEETSPGRMPRR